MTNRICESIKIEGRVLVRIAQVEIAAGHRNFVPFGRTCRGNLAGRGDDATPPDLGQAFLDPRLGHARSQVPF